MQVPEPRKKSEKILKNHRTLIQSNSRTFRATLKSFLDGSVNIFEDKDVLDHLNDEVPVVMEMIFNIITHENVSFLPEPVRNMFESLLKLG